jgi:3'(2'), 5'-bisphosphate nucleotidase
VDQRADARLARRLASEAGALLLRLRESPLWPDMDLAQRREAGDAASQRFLVAELAAASSSDLVLSEEAEDDQRRLGAERVWIIDPLDGTREFAEGRSDWAVHVALWQRGELAAGAVALPGLGTTLSTVEPPRHPVPPRGRGRIAVSRTRAPAIATQVAARLAADLVPMGSAGYKVAAVVLGEVDAYIHAGGQYEWDSAAPVAVARAAGLHTSRLDGSPLQYNQPDPYLADLVVCRPELADPLLAAISEQVARGSVR